jgi:penicillin-insensitive murein DD-endopeptidase
MTQFRIQKGIPSKRYLQMPIRYLLLTCVCIGIASGEKPQEAKPLFGAATKASSQEAASYGGYSKGCLAGGEELVETGSTWQAMRLSRNRNWGHPDMISFIQELSFTASSIPGWNGLYVGDISQPRGGPMLTGHKSHQIGLDVDIWMLPGTDLTLSEEKRETLSSISTRKSKGAYVNDNWTAAHHQVLKAAAQDPRVARIFIFPGAKVQMCEDEKGDREWLRKIRPWFGHHHHFHVRLQCPEGTKDCKNQSSPPAGDGCQEAEGWVADILNPSTTQKVTKKKPELTLADLPEQCSEVIEAP